MLQRYLVAGLLLLSTSILVPRAHAQAFQCNDQSAAHPNSMICGTGAVAVNSEGWTAIGLNTVVNTNAVAVGSEAIAIGQNSTAIGRVAHAENQDSIAIGFDSQALANGSVVVGNHALAFFTAPNSVVLGAGSVALEANTVSVGDIGTERRIVNVADPTGLTDAANRRFVQDQAAATLNAAGTLVTGGGTNASFASVNANGGGITNAGTISGVADATAADQAVNFNQLNASQGASQLFATNLVSTGTTVASFASVSASGVTISNGRISGVGNAITADQAVNLSQLQADTTANRNLAISLVTSGTTTAHFAGSDMSNGGIVRAGTISGVTAATAGDQAVNFAQLQAVFTQLVQSGLCRINGASVSCGTAGANNALAVGSNSSVGAGADDAIALGTNAQAQSAGGIAMGHNATAVQANSVAIGTGALAQSSVAVGTGARATGTNTTALGDNAVASGQSSVALGNNAAATHNNSVAIGNGSQTNGANTVSVGAAGAERRITNVAAGTAGTDAVNVAQLNAALTGVTPQLDERFAAANAYTDTKIRGAREYAARGIAANAAMVSVTPSQVGKTALGMGAGYYDGETAFGVSIARALRANLTLSGSVAAVSGGDAVARVGVGFEF